MVTRISENLKIESIPARGNRAYIPFKGAVREVDTPNLCGTNNRFGGGPK